MVLKFKMNTRGHFALAQITLLILGVIAVGWAIGSEVRTVSGNGGEDITVLKKGDETLGRYQPDSEGGEWLNKIPNSGEGPSMIYKLPSTGDVFDISQNQPEAVLLDGVTLTPVFTTEVLAPAGATLPIGTYSYRDDISPPATSIHDYPQAEIDALKGGTGPPAVDPPEYVDSWRGQDVGPDGSIIRETASPSAGGINHAAALSTLGSQLGRGLEWSLIAVAAIQIVGRIAGMDDKSVNALSGAAFGGIMAGKTFYGLFQEGGYFGESFGSWGSETFSGNKEFLANLFKQEVITNAQFWGAMAGVAVAAIILYKMYQKEETETVSFRCEPWEAPSGGNMCEQCNKQGILPCSEYQCKSLGQSCQLINKGTTEEKCTWVNKRDVTAPVMSLWNDVLTKEHKYSPDTTISPPDRGTKIIYSGSKDGCIKAFTPLVFGIVTDEPASCKLDYQRTQSFDNMSYYFGGTPNFLYNHTQVMSLPGSSALAAENITIQNNGEYSLFIRCKDSNGNANTGTFVFRFCVEKGADTTPPLIVTTNLLNNMPVAYNQSKIDLEVYTNEPATCRWSHLDQGYEKMEQTMKCSSSVLEMNAQMVYKCKTELNGIKSEVKNDFYIRCEDKPLEKESDRNRHTQSTKLTIIGTKPLVINSVEPNGTVKDSTETVKVTLGAKTSAGYSEGNSTCYYSPTQTASDYVAFFNTDSYIHSQDLWLPEGDYTYYIKCIDLGGNADTNQTTFKVETDTESPIIVRAYNEESNLKIITDESAECVYGTTDCNYAIKDGIKMSSTDNNKTQHYVAWEVNKVFYIKCADKYTNEPYPNQCSMTLQPYTPQDLEEDED